MPTITIDLSWFAPWLNQVAQLPPWLLFWDIFKYGGFIPFLVAAFEWAKGSWLHSRQMKYEHGLTFVVLNISIPRTNEQTPKAVEAIFSHLAGTHKVPNFKEKWLMGMVIPPLSFELASIDGQTRFLVRVPTVYRDLIEAAVFSQYPDAEISEIADYTDAVPHHYPDPEWDCWGTEFVLAKNEAFPIRTWQEFEHVLSGEFKDPLSGLLESMSRLKAGEQVWIQILVSTTDQSWVKEASHLTKKMMGKEPKHKPTMLEAIGHHAADIAIGVVREMTTIGPAEHAEPKKDDKAPNLSPGERKVLEAIENKMSKTGFHCKMRMIYVGKRSAYRKGAILSMIRGAIGIFGSLDGNAFKPYGKVIPKSDYFWQAWSAEKKKTEIISAFHHRSEAGAPGFILNTEELASLWHFPQIFVKAPMIKKVDSKKVEPPFELPIA